MRWAIATHLIIWFRVPDSLTQGQIQPTIYQSSLHSNTCGNMLSQEYVANHIKSMGGVKPKTLCKKFEKGLACAVWTDKGRDGLAPADGKSLEHVMQPSNAPLARVRCA